MVRQRAEWPTPTSIFFIGRWKARANKHLQQSRLKAGVPLTPPDGLTGQPWLLAGLIGARKLIKQAPDAELTSCSNLNSNQHSLMALCGCCIQVLPIQVCDTMKKLLLAGLMLVFAAPVYADGRAPTQPIPGTAPILQPRFSDAYDEEAGSDAAAEIARNAPTMADAPSWLTKPYSYKRRLRR